MSTILIDPDLKLSARFRRYCDMILFHWRTGNPDKSQEWLDRLCTYYDLGPLTLKQFIASMFI